MGMNINEPKFIYKKKCLRLIFMPTGGVLYGRIDR